MRKRVAFVRNKYYTDSGMDYVFERLHDEFDKRFKMQEKKHSRIRLCFLFIRNFKIIPLFLRLPQEFLRRAFPLSWLFSLLWAFLRELRRFLPFLRFWRFSWFSFP